MSSPTTVTLTAPGTWTVDTAASTAAFTARGAFGKEVRGTIPVRSGKVEIGGGGRPLTVDALLDLAGVDTGHARRDKDLRGPKLLDAAHPALRFSSGEVTPTPAGWTITGTLHVKGREVPLTLTATAAGAEAAGAVRVVAVGGLDRRDAGVRAPGFLIGHHVGIEVTATLHRA